MKTATILTVTLFALAALAMPVHADEPEPERDAPREQDERREARQKMAERDEKMKDRHAKWEAKHAGKLDRAEQKCDAIENKTGERPDACDRLDKIHDKPHQARRAAHHGFHAIKAWSHLNDTLAKLEARFEAKLLDENLSDNQTLAFQAKLERIDAMQEKLAAKIARMEDKMSGLESRWEEAKDHLKDKRAKWAKQAEKRMAEHKGAGHDKHGHDDAPEDEGGDVEQDGQGDAQGNATADP